MCVGVYYYYFFTQEIDDYEIGIDKQKNIKQNYYPHVIGTIVLIVIRCKQ